MGKFTKISRNIICCESIQMKLRFEVDCRLGCCYLKSGGRLPTFRMCFTPPSSGRQPRLHCSTPLKTRLRVLSSGFSCEPGEVPKYPDGVSRICIRVMFACKQDFCDVTDEGAAYEAPFPSSSCQTISHRCFIRRNPPTCLGPIY